MKRSPFMIINDFIFKSNYRFSLLARYGFLRFMSDEQFIRKKWRYKFGTEINLDNPQTLNEKLQWLKLNDRKPAYTMMVDKYEAKKFVAEKIGDQYIVPTLGVWDRFKDIDFDALPQSFVLKCTHDSGGLEIVRDKSKIDYRSLKKKINKCLKRNYYWSGREWPYKNVKPRIIAEELLSDGKDIIDYKFFCFKGIPQFLYISHGLEDHSTAEISFYDFNGEEMWFHRSDYKRFENAELPSNFEIMRDLSQKIAMDTQSSFVRIDMYSIKDKIYFSEITFSPCGGMIPFDPADADEAVGKLLEL